MNWQCGATSSGAFINRCTLCRCNGCKSLTAQLIGTNLPEQRTNAPARIKPAAPPPQQDLFNK